LRHASLVGVRLHLRGDEVLVVVLQLPESRVHVIQLPLDSLLSFVFRVTRSLCCFCFCEVHVIWSVMHCRPLHSRLGHLVHGVTISAKLRSRLFSLEDLLDHQTFIDLGRDLLWVRLFLIDR
jgi:hypothetical protein